MFPVESHGPISSTLLICFLSTHYKVYTLIYTFIRNSVALACEWMLRDKVQADTAEKFFIVQKSISLLVLAEANVQTHDGSARVGWDKGLPLGVEAPGCTICPSPSKAGISSDVLTGSSPLRRPRQCLMESVGEGQDGHFQYPGQGGHVYLLVLYPPLAQIYQSLCFWFVKVSSLYERLKPGPVEGTHLSSRKPLFGMGCPDWERRAHGSANILTCPWLTWRQLKLQNSLWDHDRLCAQCCNWPWNWNSWEINVHWSILQPMGFLEAWNQSHYRTPLTTTLTASELQYLHL